MGIRRFLCPRCCGSSQDESSSSQSGATVPRVVTCNGDDWPETIVMVLQRNVDDPGPGDFFNCYLLDGFTVRLTHRILTGNTEVWCSDSVVFPGGCVGCVRLACNPNGFYGLIFEFGPGFGGVTCNVCDGTGCGSGTTERQIGPAPVTLPFTVSAIGVSNSQCSGCGCNNGLLDATFMEP